MNDTTFSKAVAQLEVDLDELGPATPIEENGDTTARRIKIQREDVEIMKKFYGLPGDCNPDDYFEYMTPAENERNERSCRTAQRFLESTIT
jgi:hypothetical protein